MNRSTRCWFAALLTALATAAPAKIVASSNFPGVQEFVSNGAYIALTTTGGTTLNVNASKAGKHAITFSMMCSVISNNGNVVWIDIDLEVNGTAVAPTAGDFDAFCSTAGADALFQHGSITVVADLVQGANTVRVKNNRSSGFVGGGGPTFGKTSTVVLN